MDLVSDSIAVRYPWQDAQWQHLQNLHASDRLPHALLLAGASGVGKKRFALALSHYLLCESPELGNACGQCRQCVFAKQGTHPDIKWLGLEEKSKQIKIEQVRELVKGFGHTSQQGGYKVAIITPADAMNINAANGLLKSLEEATDNTLLILISDAPSQLLPTIRSRCQRVDFPIPDESSSLAWLGNQLPANSSADELLAESQGQPLTALAIFQQDGLEHRRQLSRDCLALFGRQTSAVKIAEQWMGYDLVDCLSWLSQKITDMIAYRLGGRANKLTDPWLKLAMTVNPQQLYSLLDELNQIRDKLNHGANPNRQLLLEKILLQSFDKIQA
jgi:DNA polymerase-3 subunit delta'